MDCPGGRSTGEIIFNLIKTSLSSHGLDLDKIMGAASDTTNSMIGEHNSVKSRFLNLNPKIFYSKCVCHSAALVASYACEELPKSCEQLVRDISSYFSHSAIREANWKLTQEMCELNPKKIPKLCFTRW